MASGKVVRIGGASGALNDSVIAVPQLLRVHDERLLTAVLETEVETLVHLDPDTVLGPHSAEAALRAAGAAVAAVDAVMHGARRAFCAVRPR